MKEPEKANGAGVTRLGLPNCVDVEVPKGVVDGELEGTLTEVSIPGEVEELIGANTTGLVTGEVAVGEKEKLADGAVLVVVVAVGNVKVLWENSLPEGSTPGEGEALIGANTIGLVGVVFVENEKPVDGVVLVVGRALKGIDVAAEAQNVDIVPKAPVVGFLV